MQISRNPVVGRLGSIIIVVARIQQRSKVRRARKTTMRIPACLSPKSPAPLDPCSPGEIDPALLNRLILVADDSVNRARVQPARDWNIRCSCVLGRLAEQVNHRRRQIILCA
jgi:hypothetical protein